jgi:ADP-ribosylglycohydrolase
MNTKTSITKYQACLIGGAIGDALGAPIEFMSTAQIQTKFGLQGIRNYVEFSNGKGMFTDDTQMTLFTAEALLRAYHRAELKGISGALNQIAHDSYLRWLYTQDNTYHKENQKNDGWLIRQPGLYRRRAPGTTCLASLHGGIPGTIENPINVSKGCGTIMRMAPVGLMYFGQPEQAFKVGCELSAITHGHPSGFLSGGFFAALIADLAVAKNLEISIQSAIKLLKKWKNHEETLESVKGAIDFFNETKSTKLVTPQMVETLGSGWVAEEALAISLYTSLIHENDFKKGVLLAVNHSGDCDSTGSITGNILGLINGLESIPEPWISNLEDKDLVLEVAGDLYIQLIIEEDPAHKIWWDKYPGC